MLNLIFRFRHSLHLVIYLAAFGISWAQSGGVGGSRVWIALPMALATDFRIDLGTAIVSVTAMAIALAFAGAFLRTWGAAYLGSETVHDPALRGGEIASQGPFRYIRNPLYVGTMLHTLALSMLMSPSGAIFCILAIAALQVALVMSEERFLLNTQRAAYSEYCERVPRVIPRFGGSRATHAVAGRWRQAFAGEIYMWGAAVSFAAFGFRYNAILVLQGVLVSFGLAVVLRGIQRKR